MKYLYSETNSVNACKNCLICGIMADKKDKSFLKESSVVISRMKI